MIVASSMPALASMIPPMLSIDRRRDFSSDNPLYPNYNRPGNSGKRNQPEEGGRPGN